MVKIDIKKLEKELRQITKRKSIRINYNKVLWVIVIILAVISLILLAILIINQISTSPKLIECATPECFITKANACEKAAYETKIETITMRITTNDCELKKEVIDVDEEEPESIQELFKGAEMTCEYEKGEFDRKYIDQISYDLAACEGSLVEAIKAVL